MRSRGPIIAFVLVYYGASSMLHWAMWRWFRHMAPSFTERHRRALLAVLGVLFFLPLFREVAFLWPGLFRKDGGGAVRPTLVAVGTLWHLTVWMAMASIGAAKLARWAFERYARRAPALQPAPSQPEPSQAALPQSRPPCWELRWWWSIA